MELWRKPFDQADKAAKLGRVLIDSERCKGCGYCVEFCPRGVLKMSSELGSKGYYMPEIEDEDKCVGCSLCDILCPEFAIQVLSRDDES